MYYPTAEDYAERRQQARGIGSFLASAIPGVGDVKDAQEAATGFDLVSGEKLTAEQRAITVIAAVVPIVGGKALREVGSSIKLSRNMGGGKPANWAAHHIVPKELKAAEGLRRQLLNTGIGINDAANGVFLRPNGLHARLNDRRYVRWVQSILEDASDEADVAYRLRVIFGTLDEWDERIAAAKGAEREQLIREFWEAISLR